MCQDGDGDAKTDPILHGEAGRAAVLAGVYKATGLTFRVFAANLPYNLALEQLDKKLKEATPEKLHDREGLQAAIKSWTKLLDGMDKLRIGDSADEMAHMLQLDNTETYRALKLLGEVVLPGEDKRHGPDWTVFLTKHALIKDDQGLVTLVAEERGKSLFIKLWAHHPSGH